VRKIARSRWSHSTDQRTRRERRKTGGEPTRPDASPSPAIVTIELGSLWQKLHRRYFVFRTWRLRISHVGGSMC
jgi:hypothetical protein